MQPRLLRVADSSTAFASLLESASDAGVRIGWLDLEAGVTLPKDLGTAAEAGAIRAVGVEAGRVVVAKRLAGEPVLRDLVREHFTGCRLLLVRARIEAPEISSEAGGWRIRWTDGVERKLSTEELLAELRKPRFP